MVYYFQIVLQQTFCVSTSFVDVLSISLGQTPGSKVLCHAIFSDIYIMCTEIFDNVSSKRPRVLSPLFTAVYLRPTAVPGIRQVLTTSVAESVAESVAADAL